MDALVLKDGIRIGETVYTRLSISPLTAGEAIDATIAGEKVKLGINGQPVIVESPTLISAERLRRQVKHLESETGETLQGPIQLGDIRKMSEGDYRVLLDHASTIDGLYLAREDGKKTGGREEAGADGDTDGSGA
tara:strand:+ start:93 stop:497 length:405 start_codon:yes stop_codon:yes gene_type:complete